MVACCAMVLSSLSIWAALVACDGLSEVPILNGEHCANDRDVEVGCVLDGDTFQVGACGGESVRLLGINAPEIEHPDQVEECFGPESGAWLTDRLLGETVTLKFDATCTDDYDRTLAYVYWQDASVLDANPDADLEFINQSSVREGQSRVYSDFDDILLADLLYNAETLAREDGVGIWAECD